MGSCRIQAQLASKSWWDSPAMIGLTKAETACAALKAAKHCEAELYCQHRSTQKQCKKTNS